MKPLKRHEITTAILELIPQFGRENFWFINAEGINGGGCEEFADKIVNKLGHPPGLAVIGFDNLTGRLEPKMADGIFYEETLVEFRVMIPAGLTVEKLNKGDLGEVCFHIFLRWETPGGYLYFDSECPEGTQSPFSLPIARRSLFVEELRAQN